MSPIDDDAPVDLIRWTFTADPDRRLAIELPSLQAPMRMHRHDTR